MLVLTDARGTSRRARRASSFNAPARPPRRPGAGRAAPERLGDAERTRSTPRCDGGASSSWVRRHRPAPATTTSQSGRDSIARARRDAACRRTLSQRAPPPCAGGVAAAAAAAAAADAELAAGRRPQHALAMAPGGASRSGRAAKRAGLAARGAQEGGFAVSLDALRSVKLKSAAARPAAAPPAEPADSELITAMRAKLKRVKSPVIELELSSPPPASVGRAPLQQLAASTAARRPRPAQTPPTQPRLPSPGWGFLRIWRAPPPPVACAPLAEACTEKENTPHGARRGGRRPRRAVSPQCRRARRRSRMRCRRSRRRSIRARSEPARHDWLDVD